MKNCGNCVYKDLKITQEPCMRCKYNEYWEADEEDNKHITIEVIEIHKFASPDDVKDLDFPNSKSSEDK